MAQLSDSISRSHATEFSIDTAQAKSSTGFYQKPEPSSKYYNFNGANEVNAHITKLKKTTGIAIQHQEFAPPPKEIKITLHDLDKALAQTRATELNHQRIELQRLNYASQLMKKTAPIQFDKRSDENKQSERQFYNTQLQSNKFELNNPILNTYIEKIFIRKRKLTQKIKERSNTISPFGGRKESSLGEEEPEPRINSKFCYKTGVPFFNERISVKFKPDEILSLKGNNETAIAPQHENVTTSFDYTQFVTDPAKYATKPNCRPSTSRREGTNLSEHTAVSNPIRVASAHPNRERSSEMRGKESSRADYRKKNIVPLLQLAKRKDGQIVQFEKTEQLPEDILQNGFVVDYNEWKESLQRNLLGKKESEFQMLPSSKKLSSIRPYSQYSTARKKASERETDQAEKTTGDRRKAENGSHDKPQRGKSAGLPQVKASLTVRDQPVTDLLMTFSNPK